MQCVICKHGETHPGHATVTLTKQDTTVIIKGVPADICENCGEYYLSQTVTGQVLELARKEVRQHAEVGILRFAA